MKNSDMFFHVYVPLIMILLLVMIFFHRFHRLRYLYLTTFFVWLVTLIAYFIFSKQPVGYKDPRPWMHVIPFICVFGSFGGSALSIWSVSKFVLEFSQRELWAKGLVAVACVAMMLWYVWLIHWIVIGILSLKSG